MAENENMTQEPWSIGMRDLTVGYPGVVVLRDINGHLPAGKISFLLGGSGCGKTTLLRHIIGLQPPLKGEIFLGEHNMFSMKTKEFRCMRRRMGVLFQEGALLGSLSLSENVGLPLHEHTNLSKQEIRSLVRRKLARVGLGDFENRYPNQLSGGMRKRAALARAIVMNPPVLMCDEPTSGLDPINAAQMDQLLLEMKKRYNVTIVVVSHDLKSLFTIADHALVLHEGRAIFEGDLNTLKMTRNGYLRQFLARDPGKPLGAELESDQEMIENAMRECDT